MNVTMLRLLQLIACEKVIIDVESRTASAIGMLENIVVTLPKNAPEKFLYPIKWSVIGLWRRDNEVEVQTNFSQKVIVRSPENEEAFTGETNFLVTNENYNFRNIVEFTGFPISITGIVNIEIHLKQQGQDEWVKHSSYPVNVTRHTEDMPNANKTVTEDNGSVENQNNNN